MNTETPWNLPTPDGKTIQGLKNSGGEGAKNAIFITHGLTGNMYDYPFKRAADYFSAAGYDVYRYNLYDGDENTRSLPECTLQTHADDLTTILEAFAKNYEKSFLIGHSFGGTTTMLNPRPQATAFSLWDPSWNLAEYSSVIHKTEKHGPFITLNWGNVFVIGQPMVDHAKTLDEAACIALAKANPVPTQVIFAGKGFYVNQPHSYHSFGHSQNTSDVVEGTQHCFHEGQTCEDLLQKTHNWFKSFS